MIVGAEDSHVHGLRATPPIELEKDGAATIECDLSKRISVQQILAHDMKCFLDLCAIEFLGAIHELSFGRKTLWHQKFVPIILLQFDGVSVNSRSGERKAARMTQTTNRFLDEIARLMNDAAGVASGVRREFETVLRNQADRILRDLDVVKREEFEAVKDMARLAREENEALKARIAALEGKLAAGNP